MSWHISPWVYPVWDSLCLLDLIGYFLFHVGEIFNYDLLKKLLIPFLFLLFFWDPYHSNVVAFYIVPEVSETVLSSFHSFYFIFSLQKLFPPFYLPAQPIHSSASNILLLIPSRVFLISVIMLFVSASLILLGLC